MLTSFSCGKEGCKDDKALNYDVEATEDCCCEFSEVTFFAMSDVENPPLSLLIDGFLVGSVTSEFTAVPNSCGPIGTFTYRFLDSNPIEWVAIDNMGYFTEGFIEPSRSNECVFVRVW